MKLLHDYIREFLAESPPEYIATQGGPVSLEQIQKVNDEIESRHPAHAFPNNEHAEGSIGHVLDLISLNKK